MDLGQLDAFLRVGATTTILLLAWLLFLRRREVGTPAWLFLPLAICLSGFVIGNTPDVSLRLAGSPGAIAHFVSGFTVVFLWWFCLSCFDRSFGPRGGVLAVGLLWAVLASADRGLLGPSLAGKGLSRLLVGLGFGIVFHLIWRLASGRPGDLIQRRHDARIVVAVLLGGQLLVDLSADVLFGFSWRPHWFAVMQNVAIFGFGLWLASRLLAVRTELLTFGDPLPEPAAVADEIVDDALRRRLSALIDDGIFLDPDLTFAAFVQHMSAPERNVRKLVNHQLGFDHFRAFLNHYRLAEARRRLADPRRSEEKIIAIALDSGFASLPSFNRVFRAAEGCSPGQYREAALAAPSRYLTAAPRFEQRSAAF